MYISRIVLNPERQQARRMLANPHVTHAAILKGFSEEADRRTVNHPLWVLDPSKRDPNLFIVSEVKPDFSHIVEQAGRITDPARTAHYSKAENIKVGDKVLFKLKANPVIKKQNKRIPVVGEDNIKDWVLKRQEQNGFNITKNHEGLPNLSIPRQENIKFSKFDKSKNTKNTITQFAAIYQGELEVTDVTLFQNMLFTGIGANKSYGCGLMLIA